MPLWRAADAFDETFDECLWSLFTGRLNAAFAATFVSACSSGRLGSIVDRRQFVILMLSDASNDDYSNRSAATILTLRFAPLFPENNG
ncbi:MAG: hypothetical protein R3E77_05275 [Steroidobacteraceae bacterium]